MRPHHNLDFWKKAVDFVVDVYKITDTFPNEEKFGLTSQIRRASVSIAANIAEGAARKSTKEFVNFLSIAQGSTSEAETELLISFRLKYLDEDDYRKLFNGLDEIGKMLTGLCNHLKTKIADSK